MADENNNQNLDPILIPRADEEGSASGQSSIPISIPQLETSLIERDGIESSHFGVALDRLVDSDKRYVSAAVFQLANSFIKDANIKSRQSSLTLEEERHKNQTLLNESISLREENATLKAIAKMKENYSSLLQFAMFAGVIMFTIGLDQIKSDNYGTGWVLLILGGVLCLLVFITQRIGFK